MTRPSEAQQNITASTYLQPAFEQKASFMMH
jgi:hypothetical protein